MHHRDRRLIKNGCYKIEYNALKVYIFITCFALIVLHDKGII